MEEDVWNENVREASSVWLLMGKGYRISRSIRLQWFFQYLNKVISPKSPEEIVSCIVKKYTATYKMFSVFLTEIFFVFGHKLP